MNIRDRCVQLNHRNRVQVQSVCFVESQAAALQSRTTELKSIVEAERRRNIQLTTEVEKLKNEGLTQDDVQPPLQDLANQHAILEAAVFGPGGVQELVLVQQQEIKSLKERLYVLEQMGLITKTNV